MRLNYFLGLTAAVFLAIVLAIIVLRHVDADTPSMQDYGDDWFINGVPAEHPGAAEYVLTGAKRSPVVLETYYPLGAPSNGTLPAVQQGVLEWNSVTPNFQYQFQTAIDSPAGSICNGFGPDGVNSIQWQDLPGNVIGLACWTTGPNGGECDNLLDPSFNPSSEAIRTVALHELGHCAGLGHSDIFGTVMFPSYSQPLHLQPDDIAGLCHVYGCNGASPTPPIATATPVTQTVIPASPCSGQTCVTRTIVPPATATGTPKPSATPSPSPTPAPGPVCQPDGTCYRDGRWVDKYGNIWLDDRSVWWDGRDPAHYYVNGLWLNGDGSIWRPA